MPNLKSVLWICFFVSFCLKVNAQRERDTIKPEKLIITKQYNPSVSDAFKIKKQPKVDDSILPKPKILNYSLINVPVASTFTPVKGRASGLRLQPDNFDSYNSYARIGAGNFTSILADFFSEVELNDDQRLNVGLSHFSSQGGIDEVAIDDDFMTNALQLKFSSDERDFVWKLHGGLTYDAFNYYGVPTDLGSIFNENVNDPSKTYFGFNLGGSLAFFDSAFKRADIDFTTFSDNLNSQENRFQVQPQVDFFISDQRIENFVSLDYLSGEFKNENVFDSNYSWLISAYNPNIQINEDRFSIKLGAEFTYLNDLENNEGKFYVYPKVEGSYRIKQDNLIAFGGVDGGLDQNTYQQLANTNPFVIPFAQISPTNRQYDAFLGLKGGSYALSYSARMSYRSQENNPFFRMNNTINTTGTNAYDYANSFGVIFNDLQTAALDVEIDYSISNKLQMGLTANYSSYDVDEMEEAWNLPNTSVTMYGNYKLNEKWNFGAAVFFVGERKDVMFLDPLSMPAVDPEVVTLSSFFDANFTVQYKINNQLHAFVEAKNMFGGNYERWLNYPVQDLQILGGVSFQFDW